MFAAPKALKSAGGMFGLYWGMSPRSQAGTHSVLLLSQKNWLPEAQLPELGTGNIRACARLGAKPKEKTPTSNMLIAFPIPCTFEWPKASPSLKSDLGTAGQDPGSGSHPSPGGDKAAAVNHSTTYQNYPP